MFKSKIFIMVVAILIAITLILTAAFVLWNYMDKANSTPLDQAQQSASEVKSGKKLTPDQVQENTSSMQDVLTNLAGGNNKFIKVSFAFELENKKAKEEFEKLETQMKAIVIQTLADMTPDQVSGSKGFDNLTSALMNKMNPLLQQGKLNQILITDIVLQ
ncbi:MULTISPECIES: flagellar basal body-associated FliL family protein [unclassified Paenibacillus]|uniref:flagellar basal body-associated FliL family protein n=1 Tax=unclassified Paenibacillus TaxID=185978 RepID=UPI001B5F550C|nr:MULTISPECIES: flagellar basal body-associated FliL family protein [unclassified Paenibacillus]MBP1156000.1 flagellar FliL protein [Paenibacillus sp. PvP091]MBP1168614.1 flagellar FliL protein [Paenibacillus sp. PvR098]MBP2439642.1 flagellar FliL protein [Paenibacillus sp. PvP052]